MTVQPSADQPLAETGVDQLSDTECKENRGALPKDHGLCENKRRGKKKILFTGNVCAS
jgi:hypothetical protein